MTLMRVIGLTQNPEAQQATLLLEDLAGRLGLAFFIPMNEANRLARVLGLARCACAPVYELMVDLATRLGASVARTVLDCETDGIYATLVLERGEGPPDDIASIALRCHPADAVALALRTRSPIYATAGALAHACPLDPSHGHEIDPPAATAPQDSAPSVVARWLEGVRPDDFGSAQER